MFEAGLLNTFLAFTSTRSNYAQSLDLKRENSKTRREAEPLPPLFGLLGFLVMPVP